MFYAIIVPLAWVIWHLGFAIKVVGRENLPKDGRGFVLAPTTFPPSTRCSWCWPASGAKRCW